MDMRLARGFTLHELLFVIAFLLVGAAGIGLFVLLVQALLKYIGS
mgnify:CR=1 FL=1